MEIVNIEAKTFEAMMTRFEQFTVKVDTLCTGYDYSLKDWFDGSDVCFFLNISKRTLQTYRNNGTLPYTQIEGKMYYKPADLETVLANVREKGGISDIG